MEARISSLAQEIEAMAEIGRIMGDLPDPAVRQRVLRWVCERFSLQVVESTAESAATGTAPVADPALSVESLNEMFIVTTVDANDDTLALESPEMPEMLSAEVDKQPLESVLRSFAADFQRFADEWNGAAA